MRKNLLFYIFLLLNLGISSAQTAEKVLEQYLDAKNQQKNYEVEINMSIYKGLNGRTNYESIYGTVAQNEGVMYQSIADMQMIIGNSFYVKLNKAQRLMAVGLSSKALFPNVGYFDLEQLSKLFKKKKLKNLGDRWELTLTMANIPNFSIQQIIMIINKTNYQLHRTILLYNSLSDFSLYDENLEKPVDFPRMEITYTNYKSTITFDKKFFTKEYYFTRKANKLKPSERFQDYEIVLLK